MEKSNPIIIGILQAISITLYVILVEVLMSKMGSYLVLKSFMGVNLITLYGLLFLAFSTLICGVITLMYPVNLVLNKKPREAIVVISSMIFFIGVILLTILLFLVFGSKTNPKTNIQQLQIDQSNTYYLDKANKAKQKAEDERLEYKKQLNQNTDFDNYDESIGENKATINVEPKIYPYKININTGEKVLIE